jgi:hypothetical protein
VLNEGLEENDTEAPANLFLTLSVAAVTGDDVVHTMQFYGILAGRSVLILVDSGSSHSFIRESVADSIPGRRQMPLPMNVKVADGTVIQCSSEIPDVAWEVQGHSFHSKLRVLPLGSFDLILGMDWLQAFSPMKINWKSKWMSIPYGSRSVLLQGLLPDDSDCFVAQLFSISSEPPQQMR